MHKAFEDILNARLRSYTEEPDDLLWKKIASKLESTSPVTVPSVRISRLIATLLSTSALLFYASSTDKASGNFELPDIHMLKMDVNSPVIAQDTKCKQSDLKLFAQVKPGSNTSDIILISRPVSATTDMSLTNYGSPHLARMKDGPIISDTLAEEQSASTVSTNKSRKSVQKRQSLRHIPLYVLAIPSLEYQQVERIEREDSHVDAVLQVRGAANLAAFRFEIGTQHDFSRRIRGITSLVYYQKHQSIDYIEFHVDSVHVGFGPGGEAVTDPQYRYMRRTTELEIRTMGIQGGLLYNFPPRIKKPKSQDAMGSLGSSVRRTYFHHVVGSSVELHKSLAANPRAGEGALFTDPSLYLHLNLFYRLQFPSSGKLRGMVQPGAHYSMSIRENGNAELRLMPYRLSLNIGCLYQL